MNDGGKTAHKGLAKLEHRVSEGTGKPLDSSRKFVIIGENPHSTHTRLFLVSPP
ncbi:MAG: hypothetical protein ACI9R3_006468 [Verrucomicrobiales bacterium]|jgi:hypothetical protein